MYYLGIPGYDSAGLGPVIIIKYSIKAESLDAFKDVILADYISYCKNSLMRYDPDMQARVVISAAKVYVDVKDKFSKNEQRYQYGYLLHKED